MNPAQSVAQRRKSKQRDLIYQVVRSVKTHPSAEEVYEIARLTMPSLSLGTVYRNLKLLAEEGKINEVQFESGKIRFDGVTHNHEHFICTGCGKVLDINPTPTLKYLASTNPDVRHLNVTAYSLTYYGLCGDCERPTF